ETCPLARARPNTLVRSGKTHRSVAAQLRSAGRRELSAGGLGTERVAPDGWRRRLAPEADRATAAADPAARDNGAARLEAVLFLAREPINTRKLAHLANLADGTEARTLIRRLNEWYNATGSSFTAEEEAGGFQL